MTAVGARRVGLATCAELPAGDPDEAGLRDALAEAGASAEWVVWDDSGVDWSHYALVLVRSTWDYRLRRDEFLTWAERVPRIVNPPAVLRWNTDKRYLDELLAGGVPAVPTTFVAPGEPFDAPDGEYVVKPSVSAGAKDTARFGPGDGRRAGALVDTIHAGGRTAMVQPYLDAVDKRGETALIFIDGVLSHAIRKSAMLARGAGPAGGLFAEERIDARVPSERERELGEAAMAGVGRRFGTLPYARVDLVPGADGSPLVLEVELTEPSLFLAFGDGAARSLAGAVAALVDG